jgi:hypothetical protein
VYWRGLLVIIIIMLTKENLEFKLMLLGIFVLAYNYKGEYPYD